MAASGETVTYAELERRSNRLAHLLRVARPEAGSTTTRSSWRTTAATSSAAARASARGHYYTCVNSYLTPDEVAYIVDNSAVAEF